MHGELVGVTPDMDFTAVVWRLRGVSILVITVYMQCNIGATGSNLSRLHAMGRIMSASGLPCLVG
eukprot:13961289-Alexandrium_andersonii.AAC.1